MNKSKGETTRNYVIQKAIDVMKVKGYHNTSMNDIIEATGVKKGNLYFHFSSKDELFMDMIKKSHEDYLCFLNKSKERGNTPLEKLDSVLEAVYRFHRKNKFIGGCIFGNTALEMADLNSDIGDFINSVFKTWVELMEELIAKAQQDGSLAISLSPKVLAKHIVATLEGGIMMAKVSKNSDDFLHSLLSIRSMLGIEVGAEL